MNLLLTWLWSLFIIAAMEPNLSNQLASSVKSISLQITDQDIPFAPIGDKFKQLLVNTSAGYNSIDRLGAKNSGFEKAEYSPANLNRSDLRPQYPPVKGILTQGFQAGHFGMDIAVPIGTAVMPQWTAQSSTQDGTTKVTATWSSSTMGNISSISPIYPKSRWMWVIEFELE